MRNRIRSIAYAGQTIQKELLRKSIHITIALVPTLAHIHLLMTVLLLSAGILFYVVNETARVSGRSGGFVSRMTVLASRPAEQGFVWGPVTLGLGALAALLYYPAPASAVAIYALAFGDGIASLVGKIWGRGRIAWVGGKTVVGSLACFMAVLVSAYVVLDDIVLALVSAFVATILEMIPVKDADNLIIPLGTGFVLTLVV